AERGLRNYWGYSPYAFYSPQPAYSSRPERGLHAIEFKTMVRELHNAGIGVIMDVVFNHTAEGGAGGPRISFKGLANEIFYHLDAKDRRNYRDYTGCGNTVNCNHPWVTNFIIRCLEFWVEDMHVDGFRFDLASIFARGEDGEPMANPPLPWLIEFSRTLRDIPLIAEAWDAAGLYQVGAFPGIRWTEWNGRYRDVMRRFVRGDPGLISEAATCLAGSSDLYASQGRLPGNSINFITCHDGFTLYDLVGYDHKHNEANGEDNRDGSDLNFSWNCGSEGPTHDSTILRLRRQQVKNFLALLFLSRGVPMLLSGDEVLRTQFGNNNAWCQDNEISWFDWRLLEENRDIFRFTREMIALRQRHPSLTQNKFYTGQIIAGRGLPDIVWHGVRLHEPLWNDPTARFLACTIAGLTADEEDLQVMLNMGETPLPAPLPMIPGRAWQRAVDTARNGTEDIIPRVKQKRWQSPVYPVQPRSVVVMEARPAAA
ncbi:MAG: alpha-amylase family glycosyl hydrolase, partial [Candidatus Omnitrophica bacterium]|nr:alpha-amylase family glycosyl hydrolase [Candidatus Omnitrophota bacterium]